MALSLAAAITREKNKLHGGAPFIWLFDFDRDGTNRLRLTQHPEAVTFRSVTYTPISMQMGDVDEDPGTLTEIKVAFSNVTGVAQGYFESGELLDRRCTVRLIAGTQQGASSGAISATYYVHGANCSRDAVVVTLGNWSLSQIPAPRDRFIRSRCRVVFKSTECGYTGALTTCSKAFDHTDGCLGRANQERYGGFPYLLTGREAMGLFGE